MSTSRKVAFRRRRLAIGYYVIAVATFLGCILFLLGAAATASNPNPSDYVCMTILVAIAGFSMWRGDVCWRDAKRYAKEDARRTMTDGIERALREADAYAMANSDNFLIGHLAAIRAAIYAAAKEKETHKK